MYIISQCGWLKIKSLNSEGFLYMKECLLCLLKQLENQTNTWNNHFRHWKIGSVSLWCLWNEKQRKPLQLLEIRGWTYFFRLWPKKTGPIVWTEQRMDFEQAEVLEIFRTECRLGWTCTYTHMPACENERREISFELLIEWQSVMQGRNVH